MSFNIALSGIAVSQKDLNTTANNISNSGTFGFKESRAEFADVFASSVFGGGKTKVGDGGLTSVVAQQFSQGSLQFTNNALDLAITGNGFFVTTTELETNEFEFTRAGNFKLNDDSFVTTNKGNFLQVYPVNDDGTSQGVGLSTTQPLRIPSSAGVPIATTAVDMTMNLNSNGTTAVAATFDPNDTDTFDASSSVTIYDSLGQEHILTTYYVKDETSAIAAPPVNRYNVFATVTQEDGTLAPLDLNGVGTGGDDAGASQPAGANGQIGAQITFNSSGVTTHINGYDSTNAAGTNPPNLITSENFTAAGFLNNGADGAQTVSLNFEDPTQFASSFEVTALEQNGATVGQLSGVEIGDDGLVSANYSNGSVEYLGRISLVRFANDQGLQQVGNTSWTETINSGQALAGEAGSGTFGTLVSSALEQSNVDITKELVDLITAQKAFQASSRALDVNSQLQQNILQIR